MNDLQTFLLCMTPTAWLDAALADQATLLIDHAHCEKKAASTALSMMYRYPNHLPLLHKLSRLAREELRHFEMVLKWLQVRGIAFDHLSPGRYASSLHQAIHRQEPQRLIDQLIIGAFIEARSCERFQALYPLLDKDLSEFYESLLASERRHFNDYLQLAKNITNEDLTERIKYFADIEADLITTPDNLFRFHSGPPA